MSRSALRARCIGPARAWKIERSRPAKDCAEFFATDSGEWQYREPIHDAALGLFDRTGLALPDLDDWIEAPPAWESDDDLQHVMWSRQRMLDAQISGNTEARDAFALYFLALMRHGRREGFLVPLARRGMEFKPKGRHVDAIGKWLDAQLKRKPEAGPAELWRALSKNPPRGYEFEADSFGGTLYQRKRDQYVSKCTRDTWRFRVRDARKRQPPAG